MRIKMDLRNCDCMDLMKGFPDKHFQLAIVDPPYGIGEDGLKNHIRSKPFYKQNTIQFKLLDCLE